jgi:hypothetical protein
MDGELAIEVQDKWGPEFVFSAPSEFFCVLCVLLRQSAAAFHLEHRQAVHRTIFPRGQAAAVAGGLIAPPGISTSILMSKTKYSRN